MRGVRFVPADGGSGPSEFGILQAEYEAKGRCSAGGGATKGEGRCVYGWRRGDRDGSGVQILGTNFEGQRQRRSGGGEEFEAGNPLITQCVICRCQGPPQLGLYQFLSELRLYLPCEGAGNERKEE